MELATKILSSAEKLFMKYGLKSITMDDISRDLGMSKKTIYSCFENKKGIIKRIIIARNQREQKAITAIQSKAQNAVHEMIGITEHVTQEIRDLKPTLVYDLKKYHKEAWELVESLHKQFVFQVICDNIEHGKYEGLYRSEINSDVIAKLYIHITLMLVDENYFPENEYNRDTLYLEYINYHLNGLLSEEGKKVFAKYTKNENQ